MTASDWGSSFGAGSTSWAALLRLGRVGGHGGTRRARRNDETAIIKWGRFSNSQVGNKKGRKQEKENGKKRKGKGREEGFLSSTLSIAHLLHLSILALPSLYFFLRSISLTSSRLALPRECVPSFFFENRSARFSRPVLSSSPIRRS